MQAAFRDETSVHRGDRPWRLSLVLPAWNEEDTIDQAVREAEAALAGLTAAYEIIVVDDGSIDRTAEIVDRLAAADPRVRLVRHERNRGYGAALRTGFEAARLDLVAFTDADCQFDLGELTYLLPLTRRYDIACGYRIGRQDSPLRCFCSWGYNALVQALLGSPVRDIDCALKIFHRTQLPALLPESRRFFANTEMLVKAHDAGLSVVEVGVHHRPRAGGRSTISWGDVPRTLSALLPFWWSRALFPATARPRTAALGWFLLGLVVLAVLAGGLLFPNLSYPLMEPDEGRYAEIAREMATSGDWVVPTLNHQPYLDKPPLLYWLAALCLRLFGTHEWAVRLVPSLAAFGTVLVTSVMGRRILGARAAFLTGLLLGLTAGLIHCGRFLILDSLLTLFVTLSLFAAYRALRRRRVRWRWWLTAAVCCGLGVLTKGPVALVLFLPPVAAHAWLTRKPRLTLYHWIVLGLVAVGVAAPWYTAIAVRDPQFAHYFFVEQNVRRFTSADFHANPIWFYVPVMFIGCLPWAGLLLPALGFLFNRSAAVRALRSPALGFFLLWAGWCLSFFSLSRGKLPPYILPALPALAGLAACYLDQVLFPSGAGVFPEARRRLPWLGVPLLAVAWLLVDTWAWRHNLAESAYRLLPALAVCLGCLGLVVVWRRKLPWQAGWALCAVLGLGVLVETADEFVPAWSRQHAPMARSAEVADLLGDDHAGVLCVGEEWGSIPFRVDDDARFVNGTGWSSAQMQRFLGRHPRNLVVIKDDWGEGLENILTHEWLPAGMEIDRVIHSGRAKFLILLSRRSPNRAD
jgi:dolichol-phosphate mannosyltransferase